MVTEKQQVAGANLLPFYVVVDVSWSMETGDRLKAANGIMLNLIDALQQNPIISDKVRFSLIDFADDATVQMPMCDLLEEGLEVPVLQARGGTSYVGAFRLLRQQIERDVNQLKAEEFNVHRPVVFFLTDGEPTDDDSLWHSTFAQLTEFDKGSGSGFGMYPNIIPFGVGEAPPKVLQALIHPKTGNKAMKCFFDKDGHNAALAIKSMAEILISSVLASGQSLADGASGVMLPAPESLPSGIVAVGADDDDFL
jgi:hypothetical protein